MKQVLDDKKELAFISAKQYIADKDYRMALVELQGIDDPKAAEWKYNLNRIIKREKDKEIKSLLTFAIVGTIVAAIVITIISLIILSNRQIDVANNNTSSEFTIVITPTPHTSEARAKFICGQVGLEQGMKGDILSDYMERCVRDLTR